MKMGINLKELRQGKNLKQNELAKILNLTQSCISTFETNKYQPTIQQLIKIARFFNITVDYLIGNTDEFGNLIPEDKMDKNLK